MSNARKKKVPTLGNRKVHKIEVNPQCRRLGKLERAYAHLINIKRFRYYVLMFWVKCPFLV
ncbi:hypothetical protein HanLR1_Chr09g0328071 [Helianthus annuus]|nr:hypothetical protein HanLR1_Chr09g0328071 [Helianthus annuus]